MRRAPGDQLARAGFTPEAPDKDGDIRFTGTVLGEKTTGYALFADGRLATFWGSKLSVDVTDKLTVDLSDESPR